MSNTRTTTSLIDIDTASAFRVVDRQIRRLITKHPDQIPIYTEGGLWHLDNDSWAPVWTSGFLAGMIWSVAERTGDEWWRLQAERYCRLMEDRKFDTGTHDVGFLFTPSWSRWYAINPTADKLAVIVQAARSLATNFNQDGKYLRTWVDAGSSFIDVMMNLEILYHAAELSGDESLAVIATAHAKTTRRFLVRGDATTAHEGWFDPDTGEFLHVATHQGWRADSSWVRGQTWAIYGFTVCYRYTGDESFLDTAIACADVYIDRTGDALVAPNDWDDPAPEFQYEASAGSVAAAAMLMLGELLGDSGKRFTAYGSRILQRLTTNEFLAREDDEWEGLIKQATYHRGNDLGVQESNMWGDYYFVEALDRYDRIRARLDS